MLFPPFADPPSRPALYVSALEVSDLYQESDAPGSPRNGIKKGGERIPARPGYARRIAALARSQGERAGVKPFPYVL